MNELIHNLPFAEYLALDRLSSSGLKHLARSPLHYRHAMSVPSESTPAQVLGTHVHGLLLEPATYAYAVAPLCDRRTNVGKAIWAEFQADADGKVTVTQEQHDKARAMRDAVMTHPYAAALLASGQPEVSALWDEGPVECKARVDWLPDGFDVLADLKTAADASPEGFAAAAGRYRYAWQATLYSMASNACGLGERPMVFVVVENEPPHAVALYMLDQDAIDAARYRIDRLLEQYAECRATDAYPGYSQEIETLELPKWAY